MYNIIFLDIDGVLKKPTEDSWFYTSISLIKNYTSTTNTKIVISSDWRLHKKKSFFTKLLGESVIGMTKDLQSIYPEYSRYYECLNYANKHKINNYIFIDDTESHFLKKDRLILTNPSDGLVLADIFKLHTFFSTIPEFKQLTMFNNIEEIELTSI